jgi:hypothetical protein
MCAQRGAQALQRATAAVIALLFTEHCRDIVRMHIKGNIQNYTLRLDCEQVLQPMAWLHAGAVACCSADAERSFEGK